MAAGTIDRDRARAISNATIHLPDDLAAEADRFLADAAPELRLADLGQKAARLEARVDFEGAQTSAAPGAAVIGGWSCAGSTPARRLAGREPDPAEALAGKASTDADAVGSATRACAATLAQIRAMILMDRTTSAAPGPARRPSPDQTRRRPLATTSPAMPATRDHDAPGWRRR